MSSIRPLLAALLLAAAAPALADSIEVGVAAAVNPDATGTPPGAETRTIEVGLDMMRDERVVTGSQGRTQMLFLDGSALTVGPDSDITLDEFAYDPAAGTGKLAFSATRGLFRFVGGKISKTSAVTFRTPTALIGVRGGIAIVEVGEETRAQFLFGERMTVEAQGVLREVTRPGFQVVAAPRGAPGLAAPIGRGDVGQRMGRLEGVAGSAGGAPQRPMDGAVAGRQIVGMGSRNPPARIAPAPPQGGQRPAQQAAVRPNGPVGAPLLGQPPRIVSQAAHRSAVAAANPPPR